MWTVAKKVLNLKLIYCAKLQRQLFVSHKKAFSELLDAIYVNFAFSLMLTIM